MVKPVLRANEFKHLKRKVKFLEDSFFTENFPHHVQMDIEVGYDLLKDPKFLKRIMELSNENIDNINDETIELLEPYKKAQKSWFSYDRAFSAGKAIGALWQWVWAIVKYTEKAKIVKPR